MLLPIAGAYAKGGNGWNFKGYVNNATHHLIFAQAN